MYDDSNIKYTFCNSRSQKSLIDHFCISNNINNNIKSLNILDDGDNLSDHCPLLLNIEINLDKYYASNPYRESPRKIQILWSEASIDDKKKYKQILHDLLVNLDVDKDILHCPLFDCKNESHISYMSKLISKIVSLIEIATFSAIPIKILSTNKKKSNIMVGWNKYIKEYRLKSIFWHNLCKECGRPSDCYIADEIIIMLLLKLQKIKKK